MASQRRWDGTESDTKQFFVNSAESHERERAIVLRIAFAANGNELWRVNGDGTGLRQVSDINPGPAHSNPNSLTNVNGQLFFSVELPTKGLWRVNGDGTGLSQIPSSFSSIPQNLTNVNGQLFFSAFAANGNELWRVNGDGTGLRQVSDINPGPAHSNPNSLTNVNGQFVLQSRASTKGLTWRVNGDGTGLSQIPSSFSSIPQNLTNVNGQLFFSANDSAHGEELWRFNVDTGLFEVSSDITVGSGGSFPRSLTNVDGRLFFSAFDPTHGEEVWRVDGDGVGLTRLADIRPGLGGSYPWNFTNVSGQLFFRVRDLTHGNELWSVSAGQGLFDAATVTALATADGSLLTIVDAGNVDGDSLNRSEQILRIQATNGSYQSYLIFDQAAFSAASGSPQDLLASGKALLYNGWMTPLGDVNRDGFADLGVVWDESLAGGIESLHGIIFGRPRSGVDLALTPDVVLAFRLAPMPTRISDSERRIGGLNDVTGDGLADFAWSGEFGSSLSLFTTINWGPYQAPLARLMAKRREP